jgi:hypothetical protein
MILPGTSRPFLAVGPALRLLLAAAIVLNNDRAAGGGDTCEHTAGDAALWKVGKG